MCVKFSNTWPCLTSFWCRCGTFQRGAHQDLAGSRSVSVGALNHIFEPHVYLRRRAQMKHTLGRRSAASAVAFLEADSQADKKKKGGMTVTAEMVFRELFDGHLIVIVLFLFLRFGIV